MGDSASIKGRLTVNSQKRMPDVILYTRDVMIPVVKPFKQSCNIPIPESRDHVPRTRQINYRNNPLLLFSEPPLNILYNPLKNSSEVKRVGHWTAAKNQSMKHTVFRKIDPSSIKKASISQNSYPSQGLSRKERNNALHFPNTMFMQFEPLTDDKDLHRASSRSIKLSRKCDLSQIKESQTKHEDTFAFLPKIEVSVSSITSKPIVSLPSQSFYNIIDTSSTVSTQSVSSFKIGKKKTFANIADKKKLTSGVALNHLHPSNSEYEINVLHYENDILTGDNSSQFMQSHLKSTNTNCSLAKENDNDNFANERNAIKSQGWNEDKTVGRVKYSWEMDDWVPPSKKEPNNTREIKFAEKNGKSYDCKIKYSWQVIGTSTQTSYTLLQDLLNNTEDNKSSYKMCSIKYSWQIIGINTQASLHDYNDPDYWSGILLTPNKNYNENEAEIGNNETDYAKCRKGRLKKYLMLNNQQTQTFAEKEVQADPNDCNTKYSWHNLITQYLYGTNFRSVDQTKTIR